MSVGHLRVYMGEGGGVEERRVIDRALFHVTTP